MGRKRTLGLDWLEPENTEQRHWAIDYLQAKRAEDLFHFRDKVLPNELPSHEDMQRAGMEIEEDTGARELFRDMKDAWRQERSRNKRKETGHRPCLFILKGSTKDNLQLLAKELGTDATALLEKLIGKAYQAHIGKQKGRTKKPKQTLQGDRSDTIQDLEEKFTGNKAQPDGPNVQEPTLPQESAGDSLTESPACTLSTSEQLVVMIGAEPSEADLAEDLAKIQNDIKNMRPKHKQRYDPGMGKVSPPPADPKPQTKRPLFPKPMQKKRFTKTINPPRHPEHVESTTTDDPKR